MAEMSADAILHPVRMQIITALSGRRLTTQQIGLTLPDVAQASLYRHLKRLMNAEIVAVVEQRPVRGVMEKVYALTDGSLAVNLDVRGMTQDDWRRAFAAFTASLLGQFGVYIRQEQADPTADGVTFRTAPVYLSDAEAKQLGESLRAVIMPALSHGPAPDRRRRLLSTVLVPAADISDLNLVKVEDYDETAS